MKYQIRSDATHGKQNWQVHACGYVVSFSDKESAQAYAEKLKERVESPHHFPRQAAKPPTHGQSNPGPECQDHRPGHEYLTAQAFNSPPQRSPTASACAPEATPLRP